jgi:AcrR family transcriptional regulator
MEIENIDIVKKAKQIIIDNGLDALTLQSLATAAGLHQNQLFAEFVKIDAILLLILLDFEMDLDALIQDIKAKDTSPDKALDMLFRGLYLIFSQKPYYLAIIFDKQLSKRENSIANTILRINRQAKYFLQGIIDSGKAKNIFRTNTASNVLVDNILSDYRLFMKGEQRINEFRLQLKMMRKISYCGKRDSLDHSDNQ